MARVAAIRRTTRRRHPHRVLAPPSRRILLGAIVAVLGMATFLASLPSVGDARTRMATDPEEDDGGRVSLPASAKVAMAVVAMEDRRLCQRHGIDSLRLLRAAWYVSTTGSPHGVATITELPQGERSPHPPSQHARWGCQPAPEASAYSLSSPRRRVG